MIDPKQLTQRRWRTVAAVTLSSTPGIIALGSDWKTIEETRNDLWNLRGLTLKAKDWTFWLKPEGMTPEEEKKYVPLDYRGKIKVEART